MPKKNSLNNYQKAYELLNKAQLEAVNSIEGPVMVIAGPGTGKTQILTTRIAHILATTDTDPSSILALTFTDSAAKNMRQRLTTLIGTDAYKVHISTFHSLGASVINENPEYFIFSKTQTQLTDLQRLEILNELINNQELELLRPINAPQYYTQAVTSAIQTLKREAVSPQDLNQTLKEELKFLENNQEGLTKTELNGRQKNLQKNLELLKLYHAYQTSLREKGLYDFEDMINWVIDAFKQNEDLLLQYQERYQYFLVDEYQDTNSAQEELITLLTSYWGQEANIFVVGDDEQSIYRFSGASLENAINFKNNYPNTKIITLTENYRSTQLILDSSRAVIDQNLLSIQNKLPQIQRNLKATKDYSNQKITIIKTPHQIIEQLYLVDSIKTHIKDGASPSQIAIIGRNNIELLSMAQVLSHHNINFQFLGSLDIASTLVVKYLIKTLEVVELSRRGLDDLNLFTLLHYPFLKFDPLDILKLTKTASKRKTTLIDLINEPDFTKSKIVKEPGKFIDLINLLSTFNQQESSLVFSDFIQNVLERSGLLVWVLNQKDSIDHLQHLNSFLEFIKQQNLSNKKLNLSSFLKLLNLMEQNNLKLETSPLEVAADKVILTTAHKAKGLEWETVFIVNCYEGKWGNQSSRDLIKLPSILKNSEDHDLLEDERRLFYVALTRAKKQIYVTYSDFYHSYGKDKEVNPSTFINEIPENYKATVIPIVEEEKIREYLTTILTPATKEESDVEEKEFLENALKDFRLSATALNTYLECAYKFKLSTILKAPKAKETYLSFGTAIHSAMEKFYNKLSLDSKTPEKEFLVSSFIQAINQEVMTPQDLKNRIHQGKKILSAYYDIYADQFSAAFFTEKFFGYGFSGVQLDDIPLAGKIDRIDLVDSQKNLVRVVDYKTGKRKTRNQIEGKTQDSDGSYKRQLTFYKILLDLDQKFPHTVIETELDFIETPHNENKTGKEIFKIAKEEVEDLKQIIVSTMRKIRNLEFPRTTDFSICERCEFKDHCWPKSIPSINPSQLTLFSSS